MGELLQLREAERQRHRIIRRREQQALELYRWAADFLQGGLSAGKPWLLYRVGPQNVLQEMEENYAKAELMA